MKKSILYKTTKGLTKMKNIDEIQDIIDNSTCTSTYHKWSDLTDLLATDGVYDVAEAAGCFWFLDIIASYQGHKDLAPEFQVWKLVVNTEDDDSLVHSAVVYGYNDDDLVVTQDISWTDFPLKEFVVWNEGGILLLPNEH